MHRQPQGLTKGKRAQHTCSKCKWARNSRENIWWALLPLISDRMTSATSRQIDHPMVEHWRHVWRQFPAEISNRKEYVLRGHTHMATSINEWKGYFLDLNAGHASEFELKSKKKMVIFRTDEWLKRMKYY